MNCVEVVAFAEGMRAFDKIQNTDPKYSEGCREAFAGGYLAATKALLPRSSTAEILHYLVGVAERTEGAEVWRALFAQMLRNQEEKR